MPRSPALESRLRNSSVAVMSCASVPVAKVTYNVYWPLLLEVEFM